MTKDKLERIESLLEDVKEKLGSEEQLENCFDRGRYLSAFEETCNRFDVEVELEEEDGVDKVFSEFQDVTNMSASDLQKWSKNPCSREASVDPTAVMKRNLRLLDKNKSDWTSNDVEDAKRTISFVNRMKGMRPDSPREGPHGCPSEWAISLLNWAYNPFDSVPTPSSESKEDLDPVEKVTLRSELQEERRNIKEAEMLAEQVWVMKDVMQEFEEEFEAIAMNLENEEDLEEVKRMREQTVSAVELLMDKLESPIETVKQENVEEMSDSREASQVFHSNEQERQKQKEDDSVRVPPVAIHQIDSDSNLEVSEDVEEVLDELWEE